MATLQPATQIQHDEGLATSINTAVERQPSTRGAAMNQRHRPPTMAALQPMVHNPNGQQRRHCEAWNLILS
jgi:hypothetical protein